MIFGRLLRLGVSSQENHVPERLEHSQVLRTNPAIRELELPAPLPDLLGEEQRLETESSRRWSVT